MFEVDCSLNLFEPLTTPLFTIPYRLELADWFKNHDSKLRSCFDHLITGSAVDAEEYKA